MGLQAVYIAINNDKWENDLSKFSDNEDLFEKIEDLQEDDNCKFVDIGKMWDGLHFLLTNVSASEPIEDDEISEFIVGVEVLNDDDFIAFSNAKDVKRIVKRINRINFDELEQTFNPKNFGEKEIYPNIWSNEDKEDLFRELKESFILLKRFYNENKNKNIIVSIY